MANDLSTLKPEILWKHFHRLTQCPRPSGKEEAAVAYVHEVAEANGWPVETDARGNLFVDIPASSGRESAPIVMIQSHLDMVCEKNTGVEFDFDQDPIQTAIEGEWVVANGTTLGADNGIGVAAALAVGEATDHPHGPLRLVLTLDEETGLTGAAQLDAEKLTGEYLLNLDTEEDGVLCVGCAGGADTHFHLEYDSVTPPQDLSWFTVTSKGLKGGHSGMNIHENRGNAIRFIARTLRFLNSHSKLYIASFEGGGKHNAIPREAFTIIGVPTGSGEGLTQTVIQHRQRYQKELPSFEDSFEFKCESAEPPKLCLSHADSDRLIKLLCMVPHGVLAMSHDVPGLVETSNNLATIKTDKHRALIVTSARSSIESKKVEVLEAQKIMAEVLDIKVTLCDGYPGWQPNLESKALAAARAVYTELWEREPEVMAVHAGLECGLLGERKPGLDMVSFGPTIEGAHSPDERVHIPSVARFWEALGRILDRLSA